MNLTDVKSGSKIILTEDFVLNNTNWRGDKTKIVYPKNLALSLVSFHVTKYGKQILLQVLRAKPIIEKYYTALKSEDYTSSYSWRKNGYRIIRLNGAGAELFVNEASYRPFDEEYDELTHSAYFKK